MQLIMLETGSEYIFEHISLLGSKINRSDEPSGNDHSWRFGVGRVFAGCFCSPKADCGMIMSVKPGWVGKPKLSVEAHNTSGLKTTKSPVSGWNHKRVQSNLAETLIPLQAVLFWIFFSLSYQCASVFDRLTSCFWFPYQRSILLWDILHKFFNWTSNIKK